VEVKEQYQVKIDNRFAALENFNANAVMQWVWECISNNTKASANES
jgi:hypothetical protein